MLPSLLAQSQKSGIFELLQSLDKELLAAVLILATVGIFLTAIVAICTISSLITNHRAMALHQTMVTDLLQKGYSVDDIERLTFGKGIGGQVKNLVRAATTRLRNAGPSLDARSRPAPPVKQHA